MPNLVNGSMWLKAEREFGEMDMVCFTECNMSVISGGGKPRLVSWTHSIHDLVQNTTTEFRLVQLIGKSPVSVSLVNLTFSTLHN